MIKHIVLWKLKPEAKDEAARRMRADFETLVGRVPGLLSLEARAQENPAETAVDFALQTTHPTWEDLRAYQTHPEHVKIAGYIRTVATERRAVDYEVPEGR